MNIVKSLIYNKEENTITVPVSFLEEYAELVSKKTANHIYSKICEEKNKDINFDKRLFNVRLLLEHYLMLKEHLENAVFELTRIDEEDETAIEILDSMWQNFGAGKGEIAVESIAKSTIRTKIIISHIDEMLSIYETTCMRTAKPEDERRFDVIKTLYLTPLPQGKSRTDIQQELADKHHIDVRNIRRDINNSLERITALIFGIDGITMLEHRKKS